MTQLEVKAEHLTKNSFLRPHTVKSMQVLLRRPMSLFLRLWVQFTFRQLRAHTWRTLTVLCGIAVGAAVFTSVRLAADASVDAFNRSVDALAGRADATVVCPGGRVPEHLVAVLLKHPAVRTASPLSTTYVRSLEAAAEPFLLVGIDPILDRPLRTWQASGEEAELSRRAWMDLLTDPYTMVVGQQLAGKLRVARGATATLTHLQHLQTFRVLGVLSPQGLAQVEGGNVAITDMATFQEFTGSYGFVDRIDLLLNSGVAPEVLESIGAALPEGIVLGSPGESKESGHLMIRAYQLNLSVLSFVSLFVGLFLVYSLVALHATSRRHELAVLLSLGASPRLLFSLFLFEGAFFGLAGWVLAIPVGSFMVRRLLGLVSSTITHLFVRVQAEGLVLSPWEVLLSLCFTVVVSGAAACQPALEAMRVHPREALLSRDVCVQKKEASGKLFLWGGLLILLIWPLSTLPSLRGVPIFGYMATFSLFCGFALLSPSLLRRVGRIAPPLLRRVGGLPAYLGGRYVRDAGARVAISVGALVTAMALYVALAIMVHSFRATVQTWVHQTISGDLFLRPKMADVNRYRDPLADDVVRALQNLRIPVDLLPYQRIFLHYGKNLYQFEPIDFHVFQQHARFIMLQGNMDEIQDQLQTGQGVIVSEVFANQSGLGPGMRFQARIRGAEFDLPILGVFRDYRTQGGVVHTSLAGFRERTGDGSWSGVRIYFRDRARQDSESSLSALREEILQACGVCSQAVEMTDGVDLRRQILRIFDETFSVTTVLLLIALFVAALGITSTLTVLVLERTQQIQTLVAVGASTRQVRAMILWEAILMVLTGECVGLGCGFILSRLLIFVINRQSFGWTFMVGVDWVSLAFSLPLILSTALIAALPACQLVLKRSPASILRER